MIEQKRQMDDTGDGIWDFIEEIIDKYHIREQFHEVEIRTRSVNYDMTPPSIEVHETDDKIVQLVVDNRLVAFVFCRRDDWNWSEYTFVFIEDALQKCVDFKNRVDARLENNKTEEKN